MSGAITPNSSSACARYAPFGTFPRGKGCAFGAKQRDKLQLKNLPVPRRREVNIYFFVASR